MRNYLKLEILYMNQFLSVTMRYVLELLAAVDLCCHGKILLSHSIHLQQINPVV